LEPDWDIVNSVVQTIQALACTIILHVHGHQLAAQLNCDTDTEVLYHQSIYECHRPMVPHIHTNRAQLHINQHTINTQYKSSICEAITVPALRQHVRATNKWSEATMRLLNDDALRQALGRTES
jgi:hypothetical protein